MSDKCCICGAEVGTFTAYFIPFNGRDLCLCGKCKTTIQQLNSERKQEKCIGYLHQKLEGGTVTPEAIVFVKQKLGEEPSEDEIKAAAKSFETVNLKGSSSNGDGLLTIGGISFLILAVILYFVSVDNAYGVANIQSTVFSAAAFVAGVVCLAAGRIIKTINSR